MYVCKQVNYFKERKQGQKLAYLVLFSSLDMGDIIIPSMAIRECMDPHHIQIDIIRD